MSTTTPASCVPGEHAQPAQQKPPQGTPEIFHHKKMMMKRNHTMTEEVDAEPRTWWNRLDKFLVSFSIQPTRADRCTYVCYEGAFEEPKQLSFADSEATEPAPTSYYGVCSQEGEETCDESSGIAEEVHKPLLFEICF